MAAVAIVTINWNGLDDTRKCLASLRNLEFADHHVYVVDNGSRDGQAATLAKEYPEATVLSLKTNTGFTGGCNAGIAAGLAANAEFVMLLNNDTVVEPDFLDVLVHFYHKTPDAGAVGPLMLYLDRPDMVWSAGGRISIPTGFAVNVGGGAARSDFQWRAPFETEFVAGCALLVSADLIRRVGSLDDRYFAYYEDTDWCFRLRRAGCRNYTVPSAAILHKKSASTGDAGTGKLSPTAAYYQARNAFYFGRTNLRGWSQVPYFVAQLVIRAPVNILLRSQPGARRRYLAGLWAGILTR